ncbi:MAG: TetR family transcriptional regulator [Ancalomicrobiaceae bacterium]|nr:TetR family transcriptional regulator [Ancalomicrobiaceae bacterium]
MNAPTLEEVRPDTRSRILTEAERLFRHYGYSKTTVADIARELGMSPANVYRFFPSKLAINEAICSVILAEREGVTLKIAHGEGSARERLKAILIANHNMTISTLLDDKKVHEMVAVAMEEQWQAIEAYVARQRALIAEVIADGVASGEMAASDPLLVAECVQRSFVTMFHPMLAADCFTERDMADASALADFILLALRP